MKRKKVNGCKTYQSRAKIPIAIVKIINREFNKDVLESRHPGNYGPLVKDTAFKIIVRILNKCRQEEIDRYQYHHYANGYKRKVVGGNRKYWIWGYLTQIGVLEEYVYPDGCAYKTDREAKRYRINPRLLDSDLKLVWYYVTDPPKQMEQGLLQERTHAILQSLTIINGLSPEVIIQRHSSDIRQKAEGYQPKIMPNGNLQYFRKGRKEVIPSEVHAYQDEEHFIKYKDEELKFRYYNQLEEIANMKSSRRYPNRNTTNNRMDHELTNFPKLFYPYLRLDGETLFEIDLKNSQFCLLAGIIGNTDIIYTTIFQGLLQGPITVSDIINCITDTTFPHKLFSHFDPNAELPEDVIQFIGYAAGGQLYEELSIALYGNRGQRNQIKQELFKLLFGKYDQNHGKVFELFQYKFPNVIKWVNGFKRAMEQEFATTTNPYLQEFKKRTGKSDYRAGNDFLPIILQRIEAEIFIDRILKRLYEEGYTVLSKHDSILAKENEKDAVYAIVYEELLNILGEDDDGKPNFSLREPQPWSLD